MSIRRIEESHSSSPIRLRTISDADLIIVLQDGQVVEQGSHEQLVDIDGGVYQRLWQAQLSDSTVGKEDVDEAVTEVDTVKAKA